MLYRFLDVLRCFCISTYQCLQIFVCNRDVTCVDWHPHHPDLFVSGCADGTIAYCPRRRKGVYVWVHTGDLPWECRTQKDSSGRQKEGRERNSVFGRKVGSLTASAVWMHRSKKQGWERRTGWPGGCFWSPESRFIRPRTPIQ